MDETLEPGSMCRRHSQIPLGLDCMKAAALDALHTKSEP